MAQDRFSGSPPWLPWRPHGLIVITHLEPGVTAWVKQGDWPVVAVGTAVPGTLPIVHLSANSLADRAVEHFTALGHTHFGFVGVAGLSAAAFRHEAYKRRLQRDGHALLSYDLQTNPSAGLFDMEQRAALEPGLLTFLANAPKPFAVLCTNDHVGRAVCLACQQIGCAVPDDIAVLGIDNYAATRTAFPPLSSIPTPGDEVGFQSMSLLEKLMQGTVTGVPVVQVDAPKVVARHSTQHEGNGETDVDRALNLIRDRAVERVSIEEILNELQVSRSTLERRFIAAIGRTPGQELQRARLERAKELLRTTSLPVSIVAQQAGFERSSSFSDFFHRQTGLSPRDYRSKASS